MTKPAANVDHGRRRRLSAPERRASIIAAATAVFAEVGYQRGTMSEVARRVGVSEPVVFQNFGSKPAVFAAVLEEATRRMIAAMHERAAAHGSISAWLTEFLAPAHLHRLHGAETAHVLFAEAMSHTAGPAVTEAVRRAHRALARTLAEILARGQAEGTVRADLDPRVGAWWLLSLLASRSFRAATMPNPDRLEAEIRSMTLRALLTAT